MNARRTHTRFPQGNEGLTALCPPFSVHRPPSSVFSPPSSVFSPQPSRTGMTLIELGIVMGIVAVLLALVLGLARHVDATVKIRRAQADLGQWHETLNRWHLQFGEYPYGIINVEKDIAEDLLQPEKPELNLSNVLSKAVIEFKFDNTSSTTGIAFRTFLTSRMNLIDPWGTPYIYDCDSNRKSYTLYSCGPDSGSTLNNKDFGQPTSHDPTLDDIYFER